MRKNYAPALTGLGFFLIVAGMLGALWAPGVVKKTPLDVETTTWLTGSAAKITEGMVSKPIYAQSVTMVDSGASTDDVAIWSQRSCVAYGVSGRCFDKKDPNKVIVPIPELVTGSKVVFGSDRVSAEGVAEKELPASVVAGGGVGTKGLLNKFPFDSKKKDYTYWDSSLGKELPATYEGTRTFDGLETYVYKVVATKVAMDIAENTPGTYSSTKEIFVDPVTGAIIQQTEKQQRWLSDGTPALDLSVAFTKEQVAANVDDARANGSMIRMLTTVMPVVAITLGVLLLGLRLLLLRRRAGHGAHEGDRPLVGV